MDLTFRIIWFEDVDEWYNTTSRRVSRYIKNKNFKVDIMRIKKASDFDLTEYQLQNYDLLIIDYYFYHLYGRKQYDKKLFDRIVDRVLRQEIPTDDAYNIALFNDLMAIAALKIFHKSFSDFLVVVDKALAVIEKSQFHSYKPGVYILEAKYELLHKQNKKKAAENYDKAIMFASVLEDSVLEEKIREEKAADGL